MFVEGNSFMSCVHGPSGGKLARIAALTCAVFLSFFLATPTGPAAGPRPRPPARDPRPLEGPPQSAPPPLRPVPMVTGEGVSLINADDWQAQGITGANV